MIISGKFKCTVCFKTRSMPINTANPDWQDAQEKMKTAPLAEICPGCRRNEPA